MSVHGLRTLLLGGVGGAGGVLLSRYILSDPAYTQETKKTSTPVFTPSVHAPPLTTPSVSAPPLATPSVPAPPLTTPSVPAPPVSTPSPRSDPQLHTSLKYGVPCSGFQTILQYENHVLEFDPVRRVPKWVAEHVSQNKAFGETANRKLARFDPDPTIPALYTSQNKDFWGSGWSRGHMAPAGNNKHSQEAMNQTFYLTNIVPQDLDNNGNYWNRLEIYCRELTKLYSDVYIISGPLWLPDTEDQGDKRILSIALESKSQPLINVNNPGNTEVTTENLQAVVPPIKTPPNNRPPRRPKKFVKYEVIGDNNVAVPTHLFKIILIEDPQLEKPLLASFIIPNKPVQDVHLADFEVEMNEIEKHVGVRFHPDLDLSGVGRLCVAEGCRLNNYKVFQEFFWKRRLSSPWNLGNLERDWKDVCKRGLNSPNLEEIYLEKKKEFLNKLIPAPDPALAPTSVLEQEKETQGEATIPENPRAAAAA